MGRWQCPQKREAWRKRIRGGAVFFNQPLLILEDVKYNQAELRFHALGITHKARTLHITFTVRGTKIRVISARTMHRKERTRYEQTP